MCIVRMQHLLLFSMMLPHADWTLFLKIVEDLLNECESPMPGQDYSVLKGLLERFHSARSGCD